MIELSPPFPDSMALKSPPIGKPKPLWKKLAGRAIPRSLVRSFCPGEGREGLFFIQALLWLGFPADTPLSSDGHCLSHYAISVKNIPLLRTAIAAGADLEAFGYSGMTPLVQAIHREWLPMVAELLAQGASPNARSFPLLPTAADPLASQGEIPLAAALTRAHELIPLLLAAGANPLALGQLHTMSPDGEPSVSYFFEEIHCVNWGLHSLHLRNSLSHRATRQLLLSHIEAIQLAAHIAERAPDHASHRQRL